MRLYFLLPALLGLALSIQAASASTIDYLQDPSYQKIDPSDHHPMDDLRALATQGDVRAQFILGDLYAKGKGGLPKDRKLSRQWFEASARNGYFASFIRLAALAKRDKNPVLAYQWYTLAVEHLGFGKAQKYAASARNAVVADYKMSKEQIGEARAKAAQWKKSARPKTQKEKQAGKEEKKAEKKKTEKSAPEAKSKTKAKTKPETQKQKPSAKEYRLNE